MLYTTILVGFWFGVQRTDFIGMLRRDFEFRNASADLESWRVISRDPSRLMFNENIDFNTLKIANPQESYLFYLKGGHLECFLSIFQGFVRGMLDPGEGYYFLIGEFFFPFFWSFLIGPLEIEFNYHPV